MYSRFGRRAVTNHEFARSPGADKKLKQLTFHLNDRFGEAVIS